MKDALGQRFYPDEELRVFLDDDLVDRRAPAGWIHLRTAREVMLLLLTGNVIALSLDNDLHGDDEFGQGYQVLDFLEEEWRAGRDLWPREGVRVHSANPAARERMRLAAQNMGRQEKIVSGQPHFF